MHMRESQYPSPITLEVCKYTGTRQGTDGSHMRERLFKTTHTPDQKIGEEWGNNVHVL